MMTSTATSSDTYSWTETDVAEVVSRFHADLLMIAQSSGACTEDRANAIAHDVEYLARRGYLRSVDVMLFDSNGSEVRAAVYTVNEDAGGLSMSRPGNALWPRLADAELKIVLKYTSLYTDDAQARAGKVLKRPWGPTSLNTTHAGLSTSSTRNYSKNGWALQRQDYK